MSEPIIVLRRISQLPHNAHANNAMKYVSIIYRSWICETITLQVAI